MRSRLGFPAVAVLFLLLLLSTLANAAYVTNMQTELKQPDGTVIACFASGDEYYNWAHDTDGFVIIQHPDTGWWVYATASNGSVVPTEYVVGTVDPEAVGLQPNVRPSASSIMERRLSSVGMASLEPGPRPAPQSGTMNNIVIFIRFSDDAEYTDLVSFYDTMFNSTNPAVVSLRNYFTEASYNKLTISTAFYPTPAGATIASYQDSHPRSYYVPYNATTNPTGYQDNESWIREETLLLNAVNAVKSQIPSDLNIDGDNDGNVDNVCFIVKGGSTAWATLLWPHMSALASEETYINGKRVWEYNFQQSSWFVTSTGQPDNLGVLAHEMMHTLGAPDLYRYTDKTINPVGLWDVMCGTADPPQHACSYMKYHYMHWITSLPEITTPGTYTLNPLSSATGNCYKIASPYATNEFFVVEYRNKTGQYEGQVPSKGMVVYRINTDTFGNSDGPPDEVYVYRPNGTTMVNGLLDNASFSAESGRTTISDSTNPKCFLSNGSAGGLIISNVGAAGDTISFTVSFLPKYTITSSAGTGGSISPNGLMTITQGCSQTYKITASPGYRISDVKVDNVSVGAISSYTFSNLAADHSISATFVAMPPVKITASATGNGTISPSGVVSLAYGVEQTFVFTPDPGYVISDVKVDGVPQGTPTSYTFASVKSNHTMAVTFKILTPVAFYQFENNVTDTQGVYNGTAYGNPTYVTGRVGSKAIQFNGVDQYISTNKPVSADFSISFFAKSTQIAPRGSYWFHGNGIVDGTVAPNTGDFGISYLNDGVAFGVGGLYMTVCSTPVLHTPAWVHVACTRNSSTGQMKMYINGLLEDTKFSVRGLMTSSTTLHIGNLLSNTNFFEGAIDQLKIFNSVITEQDVVALASEGADYVITATPPEHGTISPKGVVPASAGSVRTFYITPALGYEIDDVKVDNVSVGAVDTYTFSNIAANHTIDATFRALPPKTILATAGTGGTISPSGSVVVAHGMYQTFYIKASTGYEIADVIVDNASVGAVRSYTFWSVTEDHTISATFNALPIVVTGKVTDATTGAAISGASVFFAASPNPSVFPAYTATTDASGNYSQSMPVGTWFVAAKRAGYDLSADKVVAVSAGSSHTLNFPLSLTPFTAVYRFDETAGTIASESSGSGKHGTLINGPIWTKGKAGNCLTFDGGDDYVALPDQRDSSTLTIAGWINLNTLGTDATGSAILACDGTDAGDIQFLILKGTGKMRFSLIDDTPVDSDSAYAFTSADFGKWRHVAVVYDSVAKTVKFYINGGLNATRTLTTTRTASLTGGVRIGGWSGGIYFDGKIDEFHIYEKALNASEISALVNESPSVRISDAKKLANGEVVTLKDKVVTYAPRTAAETRSTNYFYIEESDRSAGLLVYNPSATQDDLMVDSGVTLTGILKTASYTGQRYIVLSVTPSAGTNSVISPLGVTTKSVQTDPATLGLLVRVIGKVMEISDDKVWCTIMDGYGVPTIVMCETGIPMDGFAVGDTVVVTGAVGRDIIFGDAPEGIVFPRSIVKL